jgi:hypothetical protein
MALLNPRTNLRVDQNFVHQITNFKKYGKKDEKLVKELIIYITLHSQKNLFGDVDLDPLDFCKEMKVDRKYLFSKHDDPLYFKIRDNISQEEHLNLQKKHGNMTKYRVWDNRFENALLILQHEKFYFSSDSFTQETIENKNNVAVVELNNFTYIKELKIRFEKRNKTKKIIYVYKPTEEFERKLYKLFVNINLNNYLKLRRPSLEDLYLKLIYRIRNESHKGNNKIYYNITELAQLMNISTNTLKKEGGFSDLKKKINNKLNKYIFKKHLGLQQSLFDKEFPTLKFDWEKGKNSQGIPVRYANVGVFTWKIKSEKDVLKEEKIIYNDIFYTKLLQNLSENYNDNYGRFVTDKNDLMRGFLNWMLSEQDYKIKQSKYISIYSDTRGNKNNSEEQANDFFIKLMKIGGYNKSHNFLLYSQNTFLFNNEKKGRTFKYKNLKDLLFDLVSNIKYFSDYYDN